MDEITTTRPQNAVVKYYKPSELLGMFTSYLSQQDVNRQVIYLQGIYLKNPKHDPRWTSRYDILRDENTQTEITLQIPHKLCEDLKDGNLVTVGGVLGRRVQNNSHIQLMLVVSRVEVVQEQAIDENEIKRMELRRKKATTGFRNVDALLEQLLYTDQRPKIALLFAGTSITMTDFIQGGGDIAKAAFDFAEFRANFSRTAELASTIKGIDAQSYSAIAIVRGGGSGIEALDELDILEAVANLKTPFISAIGHPDEKLFIKELADREVSVPNDLGHYFKDMMETVNEKKTKSRAVLTEQIKKQFKDQLEAGQKQNKELQEKLAKLTKTQEETQKQHKEQVEKANKQNEELQKKLTEINKANETAQKTHAEQLGKLQVQLKAQTEASTKQSKEFNESLKKMQDTNGQLQKTLEKMTTQNNQTSKELNDAKDKARQLEKQLSEAISKNGNNIWMIVAIIAIIALVAVLIFR
jgi:exodeoxyribonuclease VII large subunit